MSTLFDIAMSDVHFNIPTLTSLVNHPIPSSIFFPLTLIQLIAFQSFWQPKTFRRRMIFLFPMIAIILFNVDRVFGLTLKISDF
jgi:hypothetical protein